MKQMKLDEPKLDYLSLICYNLELTEGEQFGFQWSYHGSPDVIFSRVSVPQNFDPSSVPVGRRSMCVEVTCHENDPILKNPDSILDRIVEDLQRQGLLKTKYEIDAAHAQTVPWAYPIYRIDYRDRLKGVEADLGDYGNLTRAGRLGLFWYNNMDHCIESAFRLADQLESRLVTK
jgi:protoporphyrinogen oxidase